MSNTRPMTRLALLFTLTFLELGSTYGQSEPADTALITDFGGLVNLLNRDSVTHQSEMEKKSVLIPTEKGGIDSVCLIRWAVEDGVVHFIHTIPVKLPKDRVQEVESAMMRLNHGIAYPGLGISHETGGIYFRMTVPIKPRGGLAANEIRAYFSHTLSQSERWRPVLTSVINGKTFDEATTGLAAKAKELGPATSKFPGGEMTREFAGSPWKLVFSSDNTVKVSRDDSAAVESTFEVKENKIRFSDTSGPLSVEGFGIYQWKVDGQQITFKKLEDVSQGREMSLTTGPWRMSAERRE